MAGLLSIGTPPVGSTNCTHTCWGPPSSDMVNAGSNSPLGGTILTKRSPSGSNIRMRRFLLLYSYVSNTLFCPFSYVSSPGHQVEIIIEG